MKRIGFVVPGAWVLALVLGGPAARGDGADEADQLVRQADRLAREKKYDEALGAIRKAIQLAPGNDRVLGIASEIDRRAGRFADGVEHALAAIKINDRPALYYALVAANAYGNQDPDLARRYCRMVLDKGPREVGEALYRDAKELDGLLRTKTYTITWNLDPQKGAAAGDTLTVALPKNGLPYQAVAVQVKGARGHHVVPGEPNDVLRVQPQGKTTPFQVITKVTVRPTSYKAKLARSTAGPPPREAAAYLGPAEFFDPASPKLHKLGAELKGKDGAQTVRNVLAWLRQHVEYKQQEKSIAKLDFKNVEEILDRGHAECRGYTMLFAALCRAAGVPARPVWGVLFVPAGEKTAFSSHNWDEVFVNGAGWVPVDPQKPESFGWLPTSHVRVFMDLRRSDRSPETVPLYNLLYMNGERLQFEESSEGPAESPAK
jgi:tetratricopeptide (TPR) repeat protein